MSTTIQVDCKALAFSGRPDCVDRHAARVSLTLYLGEAMQLVLRILATLPSIERQAVLNYVTKEGQ